MKKITAKFSSTCAGSGQVIRKGETIMFDYGTRKAYKLGYEPQNRQDWVQDPGEIDADNFCQRNGI